MSRVIATPAAQQPRSDVQGVAREGRSLQQEYDPDACRRLFTAVLKQAVDDSVFLHEIHDRKLISSHQRKHLTKVVEYGHPNEFFQSSWFEELCDHLDIAPRLVVERFPRFEACYPIRVEVAECDLPALRGVTLNLSRSGVLARVDQPDVPLGSRCRIRLLESKGRVSPTTSQGTVRRANRAKCWSSVIAIEFDTLLAILEPTVAAFSLADDPDMATPGRRVA